MRIADNMPPVDPMQNQSIQGRKGARESDAPFGALLRESDRADSKAALSRLLERITAQGDVLAQRKDVGEIRKYRELVAEFLEEAMRSTYEASRERSFDNRGRLREYATVRRVNEELEKLTRSVLDGQQENLGILEQLGTIRGLLVDLMV